MYQLLAHKTDRPPPEQSTYGGRSPKPIPYRSLQVSKFIPMLQGNDALLEAPPPLELPPEYEARGLLAAAGVLLFTIAGAELPFGPMAVTSK